MDVFSVNIFGGGGQEKDGAYKTQVLQERQVDIGL
jgi:hypothetical protein